MTPQSVAARPHARRSPSGQEIGQPWHETVRRRTADAHDRVERGMDLLAADVGVVRLRTVVARLLGFVAPGEDALAGWSRREPASADALQWPRRRRTAALRADLTDLGGDPDTAPRAEAPFAAPDTAQALGWLYVFEGSTLGGAIIERQLRERGGTVALRSFTPYAEGPGPMWRDYLRCASRWSDGDDTRATAVVAAAASVFDALADWLAPVFVTATMLR